MGNRAVITKKLDNDENIDYQSLDNQVGIYLHWNGGYDSVNAFLTYCRLRKFRGVESDESYAWARLSQIIANYFGGELSIGTDVLSHLDCDNYDNGLYLINNNWEIVGRRYYDVEEQNNYDLKMMLVDIDNSQPQKDQLGEEVINKYFESLKNV